MIYTDILKPKRISAILIIFLALSFSFTSCSHFNLDRVPAEDISKISDDEVVKLFSFHSSTIISDKDYISFIKNSLTSLQIEFISDDTLPKGVAYFPEFVAKNNAYKVFVHHSADAIHDEVASTELYHFFRTLTDNTIFLKPLSAFEMFYNVKEKDPISVLTWSNVRKTAALRATAQIKNDFPQSEDKITALQNRVIDWEKDQVDYKALAKKAVKTQKALDLERRKAIDLLDQVSEEKQFKTLVAKNDRKGVAALLKQYLPWEQMAPFEKRYWNTYLETLIHPIPTEQKILIFRGLGGDMVYSAYKDGKEIPKDIAQKEGNVFVMSTLLTKNQGTWNRRLRSLTSMYDKFIGTINDNDEYTQSARITTILNKHSIRPEGSPFLSFTPKFNTAYSFGSQKLGSFTIDPRLMVLNYASNYPHEIEFLLPLITFPDEMGSYLNIEYFPGKTINEDSMKALFKENLIKIHGEAKGDIIYNKVLKNSSDFFSGPLAFFVDPASVAAKAKIAAKPFNKFFDEINDLHTPAIDAGNGSCLDMVSNFWK